MSKPMGGKKKKHRVLFFYSAARNSYEHSDLKTVLSTTVTF